MRNDVKLGLAVGGLLLGVVLAYALFFSNNSKDRERDSLASRIGGVDDQARLPAPGNFDQANNNPGHVDVPPPVINTIPDRPATPVADNANPLSGQTWSRLLNEGVIGHTGPTTITPHDPPSISNNSPDRERILVDPPAASGPRKYTVKAGDSFWTIARAEYGNAAYFGHIQRANPGIDPQRLKAKMVINLPEKSEVIAAAVAHDAPAPANTAEAAIDPAKQYKVQTGDNLSNIAKKLYGRFDKWTAIYKFNEELIGPNPAVLKKDMILRLPEPPLTPGIAGTTIQ